MIEIDHIGMASRDARASAGALADILGAAAPVVDGADGDMFRVNLDHRASLLFSTADTVTPEHVAFRVDATRFAQVVTRLRQRNMTFGNDPENPENGETDDPLGGAGRVYFFDANGHLFEVTC